MIKKAEERGDLEGVKVCREAPTISHLLFADDSLILMRADKKNADCLASILSRYCATSGQKTIREYIGRNGGRCVCQRLRVSWDSEIFSLLTWLC